MVFATLLKATKLRYHAPYPMAFRFPATSDGWRQNWRYYTSPLLDALFPPRCAGCNRLSASVFCTTCEPNLQFVRDPLCACCGTPFDPLAFAAALCAKCRAHPPAFEAARAPFLYGTGAGHAVRELKYHEQHALAARLSPFLQQLLETDSALVTFEPTLLVPVPLHAARQRQRGYNQSALLARELGLLTGLPSLELLKRSRATPPQVGLKADERAKNVRGAFTLVNTLASTRILNTERILLIDDVFTTGATLNECARVLKKAKIAGVAALALTRQDSF